MNEIVPPVQIVDQPPKKRFFRKKIIFPIIVEIIILLLFSSSAYAYYYFTVKKTESSRVAKVASPKETYYSQKILKIEDGIDSPYILQMSKDGSHFSYTGSMKSKKQIVIINGKKSNEYDQVYSYVKNDMSNRLVFVGIRLRKPFVVNNLVEDRPYDDIFGDPVISPNGEHVVYDAKKGSGRVLVVDGKEVHKTGGLGLVVHRPQFSPDSKQIAFTVNKGMNRHLIATYDMQSGNIKEGKIYDRLSDPVYSTTGSYAYRTRENNQEFVVINEKEGERFEVSEHVSWVPVFSPDGKHVAYSILLQDNGSRAFAVVLDNKRLTVHKGSGSTYPEFSKDSKTLFYSSDNVIYTYDISTGQYVSTATPTPTYNEKDAGVKYTLPNGQVYYKSLDTDQVSLDKLNSQGIRIDEKIYLLYSKHRLKIPGKGELIADQLTEPVFSDDYKYFTIGALRNNEMWLEAYKIEDKKLTKMPEKEGYKINSNSKDAEIDTKNAPIISEEATKIDHEADVIVFDFEFIKEEGSRIIFTIFIDDNPVGSIYEEDVPSIVKNVSFEFTKIEPGLHKIKLYAEHLNEKSKSELKVTNFRLGLRK